MFDYIIVIIRGTKLWQHFHFIGNQMVWHFFSVVLPKKMLKQSH